MRRAITKNMNIQMMLRYSSLIDLNNIDSMQPFVIAHDNVIDYIEGVNPKIFFDTTTVKLATRKWNKIIELISLNAVEYVDTDIDKLYVLGHMYPDIYIVSSIIPRPPHIAEYFGYVHGNNIVLVKRSYTTRKLYIEILKKLAKSVIVKPIL